MYYYNSPIGYLEITSGEKGIKSISYCKNKKKKHNSNDAMTPHIKKCVKELDAYFNGTLKKFSIPLEIEGTEFEKKVYNALMKVKYGETVSYQDIAKAIGNKKAVRAVGNTNRKNKIPIIIPCHRIIGKNGKMTGYASGIWRKEWLLNLEQTQ